MKRSDLIRIIREEVSTVVNELSQAEKAANIKSKMADVEAKKVALKHAQDELKKIQAGVVDEK